MRITSKIMQNNSLSNINTNKTLQDKLNTQMATEKKINRPSDDPVVAIRALRLRTNVSQVTQYYSKNAPDADSWLKVTEDALSTVSEVITDMIKQCTSGANEKLTSSLSPFCSSIFEKSKLLRLTRLGVPVLKRRIGSPNLRIATPNSFAGNIPSGPLS